MAFLYPWKGSSLRFAPPHGSLRRARPASSHTRCQTFPRPDPLKRAVGCSSPRQVHDTGELTRAPAASVLVMPHMLINPQHPHPPQNGQGHQMRLADTA